ncbi:MAG: alpha/beta fold hydrolase [Burkholderiales bacterium]
MSTTIRMIELTRGRKVAVAEMGQGRPVLYLHGFADIHGASVDWLPFHEELARSVRIIAPAHPGCAASDENEDIDNINDVAFHYLEVLDALGLDRVDIVGHCFGGWVAAELATRNPDRVNSLVLLAASGLFVAGEPIGDLFWEAQAQNGNEYPGLRSLLFADGHSSQALALLPDGRMDVDREVSRYKVMRYASRVGFKPPYFYNRNLRERLHRVRARTLIVAGDSDRMVPRAHADAYSKGIAGSQLSIVKNAGHALHIDAAAQSAGLVREFLAGS